MSQLSEAWGFRHGQDVEYRSRFAALPGAVGYRDPVNERWEWHRAKVVAIRRDRSLVVKILATSSSVVVHNPKQLRTWEAPRTAADIERFLEG